jgi:Cu-Zn family superoxide dismutase
MSAVAVFRHHPNIQGYAIATLEQGKTRLRATFTHLPKGKHGFHIHKAGDLRGEGCAGACEHFHVGPPCDHGSKPGSKGPRHTGDLGNIEKTGITYSYLIPHIKPEDLLGRALIIHEDEDDLEDDVEDYDDGSNKTYVFNQIKRIHKHLNNILSYFSNPTSKATNKDKEQEEELSF